MLVAVKHSDAAVGHQTWAGQVWGGSQATSEYFGGGTNPDRVAAAEGAHWRGAPEAAAEAAGATRHCGPACHTSSTFADLAAM